MGVAVGVSVGNWVWVGIKVDVGKSVGEEVGVMNGAGVEVSNTGGSVAFCETGSVAAGELQEATPVMRINSINKMNER
jgi:hypothetical protein